MIQHETPSTGMFLGEQIHIDVEQHELLRLELFWSKKSIEKRALPQ